MASREREYLITELREIDQIDVAYYRHKLESRGDVEAYTRRQQRRRRILLALADEDLRRHSRHPLNVALTIFSLTHGMTQGNVSDISESGFAATLTVELAPGELVRAELYLPFGMRVVQAVVRNRNDSRHGFELVGMDLADEMKDWMQ